MPNIGTLRRTIVWELTKDTLYHLYWVQKKGLKEMGEMFGCSGRLVALVMQRRGVKRRSVSEAMKLFREKG